jgi:hypothetical protein
MGGSRVHVEEVGVDPKFIQHGPLGFTIKEIQCKGCKQGGEGWKGDETAPPPPSSR